VGRHDSVVRLLNQAESLELSASQRALAAATRDAFDDGLREVAGSARMLAEVAERQAADGDVDLALKVLWSASLRCYFGEPGPEVRARVVAAAERVAPGPADPRVLAVFGFVAPIERGRVIHDCLPDAVRQVDGDPTAARMLGNAALGLGAFDVALSLLTTAAVGLRPQGRLALLTRATSAAVWCALNLMNLGAAIAIAEESTRLARETGQRTLIPLCRAHECMIYAMRGEHDTMERIASEVEREALPIGIRPALAVIQLARGLSALGSGRYSDAFDHLRRVFDPADPAYHIGFRCFYVGDLVEAALRSGRADEVAGVVAEMEAAGRRTPSPSLHLNLRYARALLAGPADAEELFRAALSTDLSRWPFARARAQLAYGEWLRRRRRPAEARPHLRAAREAFDALGVIAWGDRARAELRSSGEGSRGRIVSAHEVLTPQELQIAQMAADGLTNREIGQKLYLSHRTISTHLHRIFPKLGITSRAALAAALTVT
jgi:DNA-binding CsgD family transcriptional regulator